ncbi:MAG: hypothetical protein KGZ74_08170 [Chitinophagaceae bacterium]|nr:hypothetical protein [Chitinophagaceae bacterium]
MKRIINIVTAAVAILLVAASCKKQETTIPDAVAQFNTKSTTESYFITNSASSVYKIPIGVTSKSDRDRTINFNISSPTGAVAGTQYTLSASNVTIKAGSVVDTLYVRGIFAGYPGARKDTLKFEITGGDIPPSSYAKNYTLVLQKFCDVTFSVFTGAYKGTDYDEIGAIVSSVTDYPITFTPQADNKTIRVNNMWELPVNVNVELDYSNPGNFTTNVPDQNYFVHPTYGQVKIRAAGKGTFSSCDNTFEIRYEPYVPGLGTFGVYITRIKK